MGEVYFFFVIEYHRMMKIDLTDFLKTESHKKLVLYQTLLKVDGYSEDDNLVYLSSRDLDYLETLKESSPFKDQRTIFEQQLSASRMLRFLSVAKRIVTTLCIEDTSGWISTLTFEDQSGLENFKQEIVTPEFSLREVLQAFELMTYAELKQIAELTSYILNDFHIRDPKERLKAGLALPQMLPNISRIKIDFIKMWLYAFGPMSYALKDPQVGEATLTDGVMRGKFIDGSPFVFHVIKDANFLIRNPMTFWTDNLSASLSLRLNDSSPVICRKIDGVGILEIGCLPDVIRFSRL
jgi:hypothetical protein